MSTNFQHAARGELAEDRWADRAARQSDSAQTRRRGAGRARPRGKKHNVQWQQRRESLGGSEYGKLAQGEAQAYT